VETEHGNIDRVSRFLRILAIGLAVIGIIFGALDRLELLPPAAVAATPNADAQHASHSPEVSTVERRSTGPSRSRLRVKALLQPSDRGLAWWKAGEL
jgi:hypothetical protein